MGKKQPTIPKLEESRLINKYKLSIFKEMYFHEIERKDKYIVRMALIFSSLPVILSGTFFLLSNARKQFFSIPHIIIFFLFFFFFAFHLGMMMFRLYKSFYKGSPFRFLPKASDFNERMDFFFDKYNFDFVENKINDDLVKIYLDCTDRNMDVNDKKMTYISKAMAHLINVVIFGIFWGISYFILVLYI